MLLTLLLVSACKQQQPVAQTQQTPIALESACEQTLFEGTRFFACKPQGGAVEIRTAGSGKPPYRSFAALEAGLGKRGEDVRFAMNGGMFDAEGRAIGLAIEDGRELHAINLRKGKGNFHMKPNGVFLIRRDGSAAVVRSEDYAADPEIAFATQSGPMLLIDGAVHPDFEVDGPSRTIRNGVGIDPAGAPVFAISKQDVSFGKFARLFRDQLGARNALYLDGSVSSLWDPLAGRRDRHQPLGPMIVVFKPAESAPGHASRATP